MLRRLREGLGLEVNCQEPPRTFEGESNSAYARWVKRCVRHLTAVLRDRPLSLVIAAIRRLRRLRELTLCDEFASEVKFISKRVVSTVAQHWTARLSVHVWDRLGLSRSRMDDLRHLLSFRYQPSTDSYDRLPVWVNPTDPTDFVDMACLVGRAGRERDFNALAEACEITVGDDGRCERDAGRCASLMYSRFARAMRTDFSLARPARPILYFDGTGGSLGKGISHAELGSADFIGDCRQSRSTLSPLAMYEGNDHALPLRANLDMTMKTFIALCDAAEIVLDNESRRIPCEPIVVGDMQGIKCVMGMTESCHAVWCKCRARGHVEGGGVCEKGGGAAPLWGAGLLVWLVR